MFSNISRILLVASTLVLAMGTWACADTEVSNESTEPSVEAAPPDAIADGAAGNINLLEEDEEEKAEAAGE